MTNYSQGSTFVELIIIVSVVLIVITTLVSGSVASLRGAGSNTLKSQATKYAEEGIEIARKERDLSWNTLFAKRNRTWCVGDATQAIAAWTASPCAVNIGDFHTRSIQLTYLDNGTGTTSDDKMEVTVTVSWQEGANMRNSTIQTYLTNWR